jgi:integral membrane protein
MKPSVLTRYRVMAYVTGVLLILLTIGVIGELLDVSGADKYAMVIGIIHGWLYLVYLVFAFDMCSKAKWPFGRMAWVLLAGTIPTAVFFVERRVTRELAPKVVQPEAAEPVGV